MDNLWPNSHYTAELRKHLPKEYFRPVARRLLWLLPFLVLAAGSIVVIAYWHLPWYVNLLLALVLGQCYGSLGFLGHETLHGSVVRSPWLRDAVGALCFAPFNLGPKLWRKWHNVEHHGHTQHAHEDPDTMGTLEQWRERAALQWLYRLAPWLRSLLTFFSFTFWFSYHSFDMLRKYWHDFSRRERVILTLQYLAPVAFWLALLALVGPVKFLYVWLVPVLLANFIVMSYIATNHLLNPLAETNDSLVTSLTVRVPRWVDVIHFNFSHHTEHHVFPAMNPKYAPQVKALLQRLWPDRYNELPFGKALALLWRTPRLYRDHTSLIDPERGHVYATLGQGLDPDRVQPKEKVGRLS